MVSLGIPIDYRADIEAEALGGSLRAALALSKMFSDGLGVKPNATVAYAWLLIGKQRGRHDDDRAALQELYEATLTLYADLSADQRAEAYRLIADLCRTDAEEEP